MVASAITRWLGMWVGGGRRVELIQREELEELRAMARPHRMKFYSIVSPVLFVAAVLMWFGLERWQRLQDGPAVNAILDARSGHRLVGVTICALVVALYLGMLLERILLRRIIGFDRSLWRRYYATVYGWLPGHQFFFVSLLMGMMVTGGIVVGRFQGERVDDNGITFSDSLFSRTHRAYSDVQSITLYSGVNAPIGYVARDNFVVVFHDGATWQHNPEPRNSLASALARAIASRAAVSLQTGGARP